jgi:hypothetical protein
VAEHPDWFISRPDKPYPAYDFSGPDLSADPHVEIRIERHYYDQTDAAVVFERRDRRTGDLRYVYHGNDGTSFPWNDTAQLDYLNPAVREQVIQTILHVARLFPVIRFDAAMTLAKRHFQRLWFPNPGSSGAIPSRAEFGMTTQQFSEIMPQEFWREVVDRVAAEVPGTLLLAEAFWLMEGYFVRTLGMHRVYNSAFMNMMRDEENAKYRSVIKNTIEFDPDILKRYVNFMSNPDERTAVDQFGTGDKGFGVAAVMSTLPGLPMFGHGQIEGFTEKYGMEYRWPRHQEDADHWLVERHERQLAPLLHKRYLFAESANFLLYDFFREDGAVDENVFAYSNRAGEERALVLYHNHYGHTRGTVDWSAAFADKGAGGQLRQRRLREGLLLNPDPSVVIAFRDGMSGLHYLRRSVQLAEQGLTVELHAYQCHVLLDWRELRASDEKPWDALCDHLGGRGVADLDEALLAFELQPVHRALCHLLEPALVRQAAELSRTATGAAKQKELEILRADFLERAWSRCRPLLAEAQNFLGSRPGDNSSKPQNPAALKENFCRHLRAVLGLPAVEAFFATPWTAAARRVLPSRSPQLTATALWGPVLAWVAQETLAESVDSAHSAITALRVTALRVFDELHLRQPLGQALAALGFEGEEPWRVAARVKVALLVEAGAFAGEDSSAKPPSPAKGVGKAEPSVAKNAEEDVDAEVVETSSPLLTRAIWQDPDVRWLTGAHEAEGRSYFVQEGYEELLWWLQLPSLCAMAQLAVSAKPEATALRASAEAIAAIVADATVEAVHAGYCLENLLPAEVATNAGDTAHDEASAAASADDRAVVDPEAKGVTP